MLKTKLLVLLLISALFTACSGQAVDSSGSTKHSDIESLQKENEELKQENEELKAKISLQDQTLEDLLNGADKLIKEANALFTQKKYDEALTAVNKLITKHPGTKEAEEATALSAKIDGAKKQEQEAAAAAEKEKQAEELAKAEAEKKRLADASQKMRLKTDEVTGVTWYKDKTTTTYVNVNSIHLYFGKKEGSSPFLRLVIQYTGENWVFVDSYAIKADDQSFTISPKYGEVERDNDTKVWEWYDTSVSSAEAAMLNAIIESDKVIIRHQGDTKHYDHIVTKAEKQAMKNVIDAFTAHGGKL